MIMLFAIEDIFTSPLQSINFYLFSCLNAQAGISITIVKRSCKNGHSCFVPNLMGESIQSFTIKNGVSWGFFVDKVCQIEEVFFYS